MSALVPRLLSVLFLAGFFAVAIYFSATKPRVLILHSYAPDYAWTRDINEGIHRIADGWTDYAVSWHYLDTNRYPEGDWQRRAALTARRAIERIDPDVLIAIDDPAQELVAKHYVNHPRIQIVFAGVNGTVDPYGYEGAANVTGIFERKPLQAVRELIQALEASRPKPRSKPRLLYLIDPSPSMQRDRDLVAAYNWAPLAFVGAKMARTFAEWQTLVLQIDKKKIDYLLVGNYRKLPYSDTNPAFPPPGEIMAWTEANAPVPVIGVNVFNVEDGGAVAVGASPLEQGIEAARRAEILLERHQQAGSLEFLFNSQYVVAIHRGALARRGLVLPQVYETFARTTATYIEQ